MKYRQFRPFPPMLPSRQSRNQAPVANLGVTHPGLATSFIGIGYGCGAAWGGFRPGSAPTPSLDTRPKAPSSIRGDDAVPGALTFFPGRLRSWRASGVEREAERAVRPRPLVRHAVCVVVIPVSTRRGRCTGKISRYGIDRRALPRPGAGKPPHQSLQAIVESPRERCRKHGKYAGGNHNRTAGSSKPPENQVRVALNSPASRGRLRAA